VSYVTSERSAHSFNYERLVYMYALLRLRFGGSLADIVPFTSLLTYLLVRTARTLDSLYFTDIQIAK